MAKHSFGTAPTEDDILEIQGREYRLQPFGMRAFRESMERSREAEKIKEMDGVDRTESTYALSIDLIANAVVPEDRDAVLAHIEDSVSPVLVSQIAAAIMRGLTDVDPTQPESSSDGSSETGTSGTDGALPAPSTPTS